MTDKKVTDLSYLRDISTGDDQMVMEMVEVFLEGYREALSEMRELNENENWEALRARAHKFKPNLAYMGISDGTEMVRELEEHAKNNNANLEIASKLTELNAICEQASEELRRELNK